VNLRAVWRNSDGAYGHIGWQATYSTRKQFGVYGNAPAGARALGVSVARNVRGIADRSAQQNGLPSLVASDLVANMFSPPSAGYINAGDVERQPSVPQRWRRKRQRLAAAAGGGWYNVTSAWRACRRGGSNARRGLDQFFAAKQQTAWRLATGVSGRDEAAAGGT